MGKAANFSDPKWDSDDESDPITSNANIISLTPSATKGSKSKGSKSSSKSDKKKKQPVDKPPTNMSSVIYMGHLPDAFEEGEITRFLLQFGDVSRMKLSRAKKSGKSKGYCFVDLSTNETATIVAEFLNGYFLMDRRLVCNVVESKDVHLTMFEGKKWYVASERSE